MKANGEPIGCMAKAHSYGQMEGSLLANMPMTKRKDTASLFGLMVGATEESGLTESNTEKERM